MKWLVTVMTSRKIKLQIIFDHTEICYKVIKEESQKEKNKSKKKIAEKYVHFMKAGLDYLEKTYPPLKPKSFKSKLKHLKKSAFIIFLNF